MKRVLVLGLSGPVGSALANILSATCTIAGTVRGKSVPAGHSNIRCYTQVDVLNEPTWQHVILDFKPDVIINATGAVKRLREAEDKYTAVAVNAYFPHRLAQFCQAQHIRLIHFSTDCVFKGDKGSPYLEGDKPDAIDLYGMTKALGEVEGPGILTLRASLVGLNLHGGHGLFDWFLSHKPGASVQGYVNAPYTGLTTNELARIVALVVTKHPDMEGICHVSSEPISKYDLLALLNDKMNANINLVRNESFNCDRRLNSDLFRQKTQYRAPTWDQMLDDLILSSRGG